MAEFGDLGDFIAHFATRAMAVERATSRALDAAAQVIQQDAKQRIGVYQPAVGPHPGWAVLADSTQEQRVKLGFSPNDPLLRTGSLRDSIERKLISGDTAVIGTKDIRAGTLEFGNSRVPARPFIGPAAYANKDKIKEIIGTAAMQGLFAGGVVRKALGYDQDVD